MRLNQFQFQFNLFYRLNSLSENWHPLTLVPTATGFYASEPEIQAQVQLKQTSDERIQYTLHFAAQQPAQMRFELSLENQQDLFHIIPANIYGDNNFSRAQPGEYIMLTYEHPEDVFCSPFWELRADRASQPITMLNCKLGTLALSVNPYTDTLDGFVRNGLRAELPNKIAVSAGYTNDPVTFVNKRLWKKSSAHFNYTGRLQGDIYAVQGTRSATVDSITRDEYAKTRVLPPYKKSFAEASKALITAFLEINWSEDFQEYSNLQCHLPHDSCLKSWRPLVEIGWTGGGILAYPFLLAEEVLDLDEKFFEGRHSARQIAQNIINSYNPKSGLFNDVIRAGSNPLYPNSSVNGWWSSFGLTLDCHCAYTNGSAAYYLLQMLLQLHKKAEYHPDWLKTVLNVLDTAIYLQRKDGNYGYTYAIDEKKVLDWDGFAGCWFAAAMPLAYQLTGEQKYLHSALRALEFYSKSVSDVCCYGSPMDTWKSVDEEGNLAFIHAARLTHEITRNPRYLEYLKMGATYQFSWQVGFAARPEYPPLKNSNWISCGGSYTSVSNPHIHPMGALVVDDLYYLAKETGDTYYSKRAEDILSWAMNTMELYPNTTGYGRYGILTERYCPSDGLVIEMYQDHSPASIWFSYNGWAAANVLEMFLLQMLHQKRSAQHGEFR